MSKDPHPDPVQDQAAGVPTLELRRRPLTPLTGLAWPLNPLLDLGTLQTVSEGGVPDAEASPWENASHFSGHCNTGPALNSAAA